MIRVIYPFLLLVALALTCARAEEDAPWTQPREFSLFQFLLDRSPFSLPTAEESSPLAERFYLSGAATFDGESLVFVVDRTNQTRHMLSKKPNEHNMSLVEYLPDPDSRKMKATIQVEGQVATIAYAEPITNNQSQVDPSQSAGMAPQLLPRGAANNAPNVAPGTPGMQPHTGVNPPPIRRVIRRKGISGQPIPGP